MSEIALLLEKAAESFDAAELQLENGYVEFAASRAYYGSFFPRTMWPMPRSIPTPRPS